MVRKQRKIETSTEIPKKIFRAKALHLLIELEFAHLQSQHLGLTFSQK